MKVTNDGFCEPCLGCRPSLLAAGIKLHPLILPQKRFVIPLSRARTSLDFIDDRNAAYLRILFLDCLVNRAIIG